MTELRKGVNRGWSMVIVLTLVMLLAAMNLQPVMAADVAGSGTVTVSVKTGEYGKVNLKSGEFMESVNTGGDLTLELQADDRYVIGRILINDEPLSASDLKELLGETDGSLVLEGLEEALSVEVIFMTKEEFVVEKESGQVAEDLSDDSGESDLDDPAATDTDNAGDSGDEDNEDADASDNTGTDSSDDEDSTGADDEDTAGASDSSSDDNTADISDGSDTDTAVQDDDSEDGNASAGDNDSADQDGSDPDDEDSQSSGQVDSDTDSDDNTDGSDDTLDGASVTDDTEQIEYADKVYDADGTDQKTEVVDTTDTANQDALAAASTGYSTPKTGDYSRVGLWISLMTAGAALLGMTIIMMIRRKTSDYVMEGEDEID